VTTIVIPSSVAHLCKSYFSWLGSLSSISLKGWLLRRLNFPEGTETLRNRDWNRRMLDLEINDTIKCFADAHDGHRLYPPIDWLDWERYSNSLVLFHGFMPKNLWSRPINFSNVTPGGFPDVFGQVLQFSAGFRWVPPLSWCIQKGSFSAVESVNHRL
jgi:hypothetical protein